MAVSSLAIEHMEIMIRPLRGCQARRVSTLLEAARKPFALVEPETLPATL